MKAHVTAVALGVLAMTGACQHIGDAARTGSDKPVADKPVPDAAAQRRLSADFSWRFHLGEVADGEKPLLPDADWRTVDLPHDWSIEGAFDPKNPMGGAGGFLPAGVGWYRKSFNAPEDWRGKRIGVEFEGVYMNADVWINGVHLGKHPYGYTSFRHNLTPHLKFGAANVLAVRVDNSQHRNTRWYSGSGIYRHVWITVTHPLHVAPWGVFVTTPEVSADCATVAVRTRVVNESGAHAALTLKTSVLGPDGRKVGEAESSVELDAGAERETEQTLAVAKPALWSPQTPHLYRAVTQVSVGARLLDAVETPFGIRSIHWSVQDGFQLNGKTIKLCGGCVHHDNGCLGAAAFDRAEERRIELLKAAGFNAVRTSHNPPSPAFLDACDRLGLIVVDEAFDCWELGKNNHDYHKDFKDWWRRDIEAMVLRDRNHPAVVIWSIGNELPEQAQEAGARTGQMLARHVRKLDATRPITAAICPTGTWADTDGLFAVLDIGGYNYTLNNQADDHRRAPSRIMAALESFPKDMFAYWSLAADNPYIIGDFVWTSLDYLGEAGIGRYQYQKTADPTGGGHGMDALFPWHGAYCGDLDICGFRKPHSYYRDIVWNRGDRVYVSVCEPRPEGTQVNANAWGVPPAQASWTWPVPEGAEIQVQVYSACDEVRLYLNDKLLGRQPTGRRQEFKAVFKAPYAPGTLRAVGLRADRPVAEHVLRTAGPAARIRLAPDRKDVRADGQDLVFFDVEVIDQEGELRPDAANEIRFTISGPGVIAGVGNSDMTSCEPYQGDRRSVFQGRAQVVVRTRKGAAGRIRLKAESPGLKGAEASVRSRV